MAQYGAVYIYYDHDLWDYSISGEQPYNLYNLNSEVISIDGCKFESNS